MPVAALRGDPLTHSSSFLAEIISHRLLSTAQDDDSGKNRKAFPHGEVGPRQRRSGALVNGALETFSTTALSCRQCPIRPFGAPSPRGKGYLYKAVKSPPPFLISNFSCKRGFHSQPRDGTPQRLTHKFESRDEWPVSRD